MPAVSLTLRPATGDDCRAAFTLSLGDGLFSPGNHHARLRRDGLAQAARAGLLARALCGRLGDTTPKLFPVLYGQWAYEHTNGRLTLSIGLAEQFLDRAERAADRALEMIGHRLVGFTLLTRGRADLGLPHLRRSLAAYEPATDVELGYVYGHNPTPRR